MTQDISILLVEENRVDALNMVRAFSHLGLSYPLQTAETAPEALQLLRADLYSPQNPRPNIIILSLPLMQRQGFHFMRIIRNDPSFADLDIVVLAATEKESDIVQAYRHHVQAFVPKPSNQDELHRVILALSSMWGITRRPRAHCLLPEDDSTRQQNLLT